MTRHATEGAIARASLNAHCAWPDSPRMNESQPNTRSVWKRSTSTSEVQLIRS